MRLRGVAAQCPDLAYSLSSLARLLVAPPAPTTLERTWWALTDASDTAAGAVLLEPGAAARHFFAPLGPSYDQGSPSSERELLAVLLAVLAARRHAPAGTLLIVVTDSQSAAFALNRGAGRRYSSARAVAAVFAAAELGDFGLLALWSPREFTHRADLLTRLLSHPGLFGTAQLWPVSVESEVLGLGLPPRLSETLPREAASSSSRTAAQGADRPALRRG